MIILIWIILINIFIFFFTFYEFSILIYSGNKIKKISKKYKRYLKKKNFFLLFLSKNELLVKQRKIKKQ
jgi:hypothetical protein